MPQSLPGEIWRVDLGLVGKVRPALILTPFPADDELALLLIIPHTTAVRGTRWEVIIQKPFLQPGAFHLQQVQPVALAHFERKLGELSPTEFRQVKQRLVTVLDLLR